MTSTARGASSASEPESAVTARMSSVNAVFTLSLILTQASSPAQVMRLVTTAMPSIVRCEKALAWHPRRSGDYYQRAPRDVSEALARVTAPGRLDMTGLSAWSAFPLTSPTADEPVFLVVAGAEDLSGEETFLISVLAQLCGTVIAKLELITAERSAAQAALERDVAQARAAELAASEARQRAILEAALDAVISIDQHARVTYVNTAFERIFGYRADEVIGRELADLVVPPGLREAHRRGLARYLATGQTRILDRRLEMTAMRADGSEFPAEVTVTRTGPAGEPVFTGYVRDITERQRAEQELKASRARAWSPPPTSPASGSPATCTTAPSSGSSAR